MSDPVKLFGIPAQIDFGNFMVGIATIFLAFVSLWIAIKNRKQAGEEKLAEFMLQWIKELRDDTARYVKLHKNIMLARRKSRTGGVPVSERDRMLELSEVRARLKMMIRKDTDDKHEEKFLKLISQKVSSGEEEAKSQRLEIVDSSREIQKTAWRLARNKIKHPK